MSFKDQVVNLIIKGRDLFSSEAKKSEKALAELAQQSEILNDRLQELEDLQGAAASIDGLTKSIKDGERAYKDNSITLDKLVTEQKRAAAEAKKLDKAHADIAAQTTKTEQAYQQVRAELDQYDQQLSAARTKVDKLTAEQEKSGNASKAQAAALSKATADLKQLEQAQAGTEQSAKALSVELDKQRRELDAMGASVTEAGRTKADYTLKVKAARSELNKLASSLGKNKTELEQQTNKLTKAGYSMDKLADASKELKQQQAAAEMALEGVNKQLARHDNLLKESKKSAGDFGGSVRSATSSLLAMAGAYIGVDRLWESLKGILTAGDRFKAFNLQMQAMMGSIAGGEQAVAWIKEFANSTGTRLESVQQAFASLKTFGIDPMGGALQSLVDYNARLGGSQEKLEGIILGVGQAWAKQKLQGEEILQLVERGVPVWELLEKVTGKNVTQLQKLSEKGQLGRDAIKALFDEMGKQANGQASKSLDRLAGQINLISNKFEDFKRIIADSGVYQVAVDFLKDLNTTFDQLNEQGKIKAAAQDISDFFTTMVRDGGASLQNMLENITAFTTALNTVSGAIRLVWNGISAGVAAMGASVTLQLAKMAEGFAKLYEFIGADELAKGAQDAAAALNAIGDAYVAQVEQDGKDVRAAWRQITGEVEKSASTAYSTIAKNAKKSANEQVKAGNEVTNAQGKQVDKAKELELAMSKAGITTVKVLREQEAAAKKTYLAVKQGAEDGAATTYELNQAFLQYAESAIQAAQASGKQVDASILQQAANLGLGASLDELIAKYNKASAAQAKLDTHQRQTVNSFSKGADAVKGAGETITNTAYRVRDDLKDVAAHFAALGAAVQGSVAKLSDNAVEYFKSIVHHTTLLIDKSTELDKVKSQYQRLTGVIGELNNRIASTIDFVGLRTWALETERAGKIAERAYYEQKIKLLELADALDNAQDGQAGLIEKAERSVDRLNLLNDQDLSKLTGAIDRAKSRLDAMRQSADDTLSSLRDELDNLQGNDLAIQQREYDRKLSELREQLKEAQKSGDSELLAQLKESEQLLKRINTIRTNEIKAQAADNKAPSAANTAPTTQTTTTNRQPITPAIQTGEVVTLRLQAGPVQLDLNTQKNLLNLLMDEIRRQQRLGT